MKRMINALALGLLLLSISGSMAIAGCENDLMFGCSLEDPDQAYVAEPLDFSKPFKMSKVMGVYVIDRGLNFYSDDYGHYELSSARMQQIYCSPGLTGGNFFGDGKQGYIDISSSSPHKHLNWGVTQPGTYIFEFKLVNAKGVLGNSLKDSPVFLMVFMADRDYAAVSIKTAHRLPNGSKVELQNLKANTGDEFNGYIYAQSLSRSCGIRVLPGAETGIALGSVFSAKGTMGRSAGERYFSVATVTAIDSGADPKPLGITTKCLGGSGEVINTPSSFGNIGLRTTGLLVKVCGTLRYGMDGNAYIYDGFKVTNAVSGINGCRISMDDLNEPIDLPGDGSLVVITGISGVDNDLNPIIRPRSAGDVITH